MRKTIISTIALALALAAPLPRAHAGGEAPGAELTQLLSQISAKKKEIDALDAGSGRAAHARKVSLDATKDLLDGAVHNLKRKYTDLDMRAGTVVAQIEQHNQRCAGSSPDAAHVAGCNREAAQLNGRMDALRTEKRDLDQYRDGLQQRLDQLGKDTLAWAAGSKQYVAQRNELVAAYNRLVARLPQLRERYADCAAHLPRGVRPTPEAIKHRCGNIQLDGARVDLPALEDIKPETAL